MGIYRRITAGLWDAHKRHQAGLTDGVCAGPSRKETLTVEPLSLRAHKCQSVPRQGSRGDVATSFMPGTAAAGTRCPTLGIVRLVPLGASPANRSRIAG